jgi:hypothetical protein
MLKSMIETVQELRAFINRKDLPAMHVGYYLGKPRSAPMFGALRLTPFDKRFTLILVNMQPRNNNIVRFVAFSCENNPISLSELVEVFGPFTTTYDEKSNSTKLEWTNFDEMEAIESLFSTVEGYKMEYQEDGILLYQPGGTTVLVPFTELLLPGFTYGCKEFDRPEDKANKNPILR